MNQNSLTMNERQTTHVVAASGRLRNEHFLLTADHLLLELDRDSLELVLARAEGNIEVHINGPEADGELVIYAASAVFRPERQCLRLGGWTGTRENGLVIPAPIARHEITIPTDGSLLVPAMQEQAGKRLAIRPTPLRVAA